MFLKHLYLRDFRNLHTVNLTFSAGANHIIGENAQGKTNLLEAIFFLSTGRSFRTSDLKQLILHGTPGFYLVAVFEKEGVEHTTRVFFNGEEKRLQINSNKSSGFSPLMGLLPVVLYAPDDVSLIHGAPLLRRRFLNLHISQEDPFYMHHLSRYQKAMKQRNELLRRKIQEAIDPWEAMMAHSAAYLMEKRKKALQELEPLASFQMKKLSENSEELSLVYVSSLPLSSEEAIQLHLRKQRPRELHFGTTLNGPHRDDIHFLIHGRLARSFASIGQHQTLLAALRLAEWKRLCELVASPPLFCLDDFGVHLDIGRQRALETALSNLGQTFITAPIMKEAHFEVKQGSILPLLRV